MNTELNAREARNAPSVTRRLVTPPPLGAGEEASDRGICCGPGVSELIPRVRGGFTLIEVLFVVIIIGLIATLIVGNLGKTFTTGQVKTTQAQLKLLANSVESFKADVGRYPTEPEGLKALVERPQGVDEKKWDKAGYLGKRTVPLDGWGQAFKYKEDPAFGFLIRSLGADGKEGGEGENADMDNRQ